MLILVLLGMYFDAVVVFVTKSSLLLRLAVAILWPMRVKVKRFFYNSHKPYAFPIRIPTEAVD